MKRFAAVALLLTILFTGCAPAAPAVPQVPSPTPAEAPALPSPTPYVLDPTAVGEAFQSAWKETEFDLSLIPKSVFTSEAPLLTLFTGAYEQRTWVPAFAEAIAEQLPSALEAAATTACEAVNANCTEVTVDCTAPTWQYLIMLLSCADSQAGVNAALTAALAPEPTFTADGEQVTVHITLETRPYKEALYSLLKDQTREMSAQFLYSYLLTVYDDMAKMREYIPREPKGNFLTGIVWPLESHIRLRKTWYADRDNGTRRHTGTDIWAKEDTPIYSCTDGTVTFVGAGGGMGNAVIVTDAYGYDFHYYHMVRLTDFLKEGDAVKAGDLIGHVGNTGNSARDHLHLTIAAPDGYYIDPYPYLAAVEP